jgi:acyl carrier protein
VLVVTRDLEALFDTVRPKKNAMASAALNAPSARKATHARPNLKTAYAEPTNEIEESVADIWASVIGIEKVGINDGFVELGGHSLLAIQLMSRVRETFQVELPLDSLYKAPTVAGMAEAIIVKLTESTDDETLAAMLAELEGEEAVV